MMDDTCMPCIFFNSTRVKFAVKTYFIILNYCQRRSLEKRVSRVVVSYFVHSNVLLLT